MHEIGRPVKRIDDPFETARPTGGGDGSLFGYELRLGNQGLQTFDKRPFGLLIDIRHQILGPFEFHVRKRKTLALPGDCLLYTSG